MPALPGADAIRRSPACAAARTSPAPGRRITATSRCFINSCVPSSVTVVIQLIAPCGAPARRAASSITSATREMHLTAADVDSAHGAARLERDEDFVDRGGRRVRRGNDRGNHPKRFGDFNDAPILMPCDHTDRLHGADEVVDLLRREEIFLNLVFNDAVARFFD